MEEEDEFDLDDAVMVGGKPAKVVAVKTMYQVLFDGDTEPSPIWLDESQLSVPTSDDDDATEPDPTDPDKLDAVG